MVLSTSPRQLGPTSTAPASRTRAIRASSRARPVAPASPRPAVIATIARAPLASTPSTASSKPASGTAMTARSTGPSSSATDATVGLPRISPPRRFTSCTRCRSAPRSACSATALPHLAGSVLAPTTAIEAGSNSAAGPGSLLHPQGSCRAGADGVVGMVVLGRGHGAVADQLGVARVVEVDEIGGGHLAEAVALADVSCRGRVS